VGVVRTWAGAVAIVGACSGACSGKPITPQVALALEHVLETAPAGAAKDHWNDVRRFYALRSGAPAWVEDATIGKTEAALGVIRLAPAHGLDAAHYDEAGIAALAKAAEELSTDDDSDEGASLPLRLAELDARITSCLLTLGRHVAGGRIQPQRIDGRWKSQRQPTDVVQSLVETAAGPDDGLTAWLDRVQPPHPEYAALRRALVALRGQREQGGWPEVPVPRPARRGAVLTPEANGVLKERLAVAGHTQQDLADAVSAFQQLHGLRTTGIPDADTIAAINVPLDARIRQVEINLERWRWLPDDLGERHLFVNLPYFHLIAREGGKPVMDIRVVVGTPEHATPIFSSRMQTVVFSPYWHIPDSIVEGETAPAVARDPAYLSRNNIDILRVTGAGATPVDPSDVDWDDPDELKGLAFRQRPGARNALGHVKFLFPNPYSVYLHDTPADRLFSRPGRAFSHGCVRVEEPETLAQYVLRDQPEWDAARINAAMRAGTERPVRLKSEIPVHLTYFTAWVDQNGGLHFQRDIYGYDRRHAELSLPRKAR
jgi:L,D-transpeptidase YcbB